MDFTQSMDNGYIIPTSVAVGSGEATDIRCVCDTVEDFKTFLDATEMDLRYEGLITYEKVNKLLKVYKGNDTWQTVGEGGGGVDTSSFITLTQLSQQLNNYYTKVQTDNKILEGIQSISDLFSTSYTETEYIIKYNDSVIARIPLGVQMQNPSDPYLDGRLLVFEDKFDKGTLDKNNWGYELGSVRSGRYDTSTIENVKFEDDKLFLHATKGGNTLNYNTWTSGAIHSCEKQAFLYGRFEAKIKLPNKMGAFPAFWTLGDRCVREFDTSKGISEVCIGQDYPYCGEIDIMEQIPGNHPRTVSGYYIVNDDGQPARWGGNKYSHEIDTTEWHIYAMEWDSSGIEFFVDNISIGKILFDSSMSYYHEPQFIILNLAVGSGGGIPIDTETDMRMYVDWVRVYAPKDFISVKPIESIKIEKCEKIGTNEVKKLNYTIEPSNVGNRALKWRSSDDSIATAYGGVIKPKSAGIIDVTVETANGETDTITIVIEEEYISEYSVSINMENAQSTNTSKVIGAKEAYKTKITANEGYEIESIVVTMGGADITESVCVGSEINIPSVTGDIVINVITSIGLNEFRPLGECPDGYVEVDLSVDEVLSTVKLRSGLNNQAPGVTYFEARTLLEGVRVIEDVKYPANITPFSEWNGSDMPSTSNVGAHLAYSGYVYFTLGLSSSSVGTDINSIKAYLKANKYVFYVKCVNY